jgi:RHS repeat-associated protein
MLERRYDYFPHGLPYDGGTSVVVKQRYTYTGREANPAGAVMYYRLRKYLPSLGRFPSRDSLGHSGSLQLYGYVGGAPQQAADPYGLASLQKLLEWREKIKKSHCLRLNPILYRHLWNLNTEIALARQAGMAHLRDRKAVLEQATQAFTNAQEHSNMLVLARRPQLV